MIGKQVREGPCWLHPGQNSVQNHAVVTSNGGMATPFKPILVFLALWGVPRRSGPPVLTFSAGGGA